MNYHQTALHERDRGSEKCKAIQRNFVGSTFSVDKLTGSFSFLAFKSVRISPLVAPQTYSQKTSETCFLTQRLLFIPLDQGSATSGSSKGSRWRAQEPWGKSKMVGPRASHSIVLMGPKTFGCKFACFRLFGGPLTIWNQTWWALAQKWLPTSALDDPVLLGRLA